MSSKIDWNEVMKTLADDMWAIQQAIEMIDAA
jgi:hypothetical protein